jgi:hypothetical protein
LIITVVVFKDGHSTHGPTRAITKESVMSRSFPSDATLAKGFFAIGLVAFLGACGFAAAGCTYNTTYVDNYYDVVEDDTGAVVEDDTAVEDTAVEDTAVEDTAVEDTGAEPSCEFEVETWDGVVAMGNTMTISLSPYSPGGASIPGTIEVLRLDFQVDNMKCDNLSLLGFTVFGLWTDIENSGWSPTDIHAVDLTTNTELGYAGTSQPGSIVYAGFEMNMEIEAGNTHSVAIFANLSGASAAEDDSVRFDLYLDSVEVEDNTSRHVLRHDGVSGNTIVF